MDHLTYLVAAYAVIFAALGLYLLFIGNRQRKAEALIRELEAELSRRESSESAPAVQTRTAS